MPAAAFHLRFRVWVQPCAEGLRGAQMLRHPWQCHEPCPLPAPTGAGERRGNAMAAAGIPIQHLVEMRKTGRQEGCRRL